eukprot:TRINITY_DN3553_c1_g1_i2.p1 TRINITY_DN3553_c1_g1~~TRINITY_DN3553_c1_g1_i2.p1  ORF type:complete len:247 (-),score=-31.05 TRINITY_DN3553_c1_g1_i2:273-1013(-)
MLTLHYEYLRIYNIHKYSQIYIQTMIVTIIIFPSYKQYFWVKFISKTSKLGKIPQFTTSIQMQQKVYQHRLFLRIHNMHAYVFNSATLLQNSMCCVGVIYMQVCLYVCTYSLDLFELKFYINQPCQILQLIIDRLRINAARITAPNLLTTPTDAANFTYLLAQLCTYNISSTTYLLTLSITTNNTKIQQTIYACIYEYIHACVRTLNSNLEVDTYAYVDKNLQQVFQYVVIFELYCIWNVHNIQNI